ncbi:MAG: FecR domain-containing protein [Alphaproteobacteria bacterium]|nr:FecR domain-containing protein [Alphaproteobacteria bacterium]
MKLTRREGLIATAALSVVGVARADDDSGVGGVEDIVNYAWSTIAPEPRDEMELEDDVYMNEVVETGEESALVVKFSDGSKLTLGENAKIVIDKYVYDPVAASGEQAITLTKGAFRFLSGSLPKASVKISTPAVTIGIRGTELVIDVAEDGETEMSTLSGEADATDGSGETLTVLVDESVVIDRNRRFRGRVRKRRHVSRSIAIAEGLGSARTRWRIRKPAKRRAVRRRRRRRSD